eukprot:SAG22_NODE_84_length_21617_cov_48.600102_12_plen_530_part_00
MKVLERQMLVVTSRQDAGLEPSSSSSSSPSSVSAAAAAIAAATGKKTLPSPPADPPSTPGVTSVNDLRQRRSPDRTGGRGPAPQQADATPSVPAARRDKAAAAAAAAGYADGRARGDRSSGLSTPDHWVAATTDAASASSATGAAGTSPESAGIGFTYSGPLTSGSSPASAGRRTPTQEQAVQADRTEEPRTEAALLRSLQSTIDYALKLEPDSAAVIEALRTISAFVQEKQAGGGGGAAKKKRPSPLVIRGAAHQAGADAATTTTAAAAAATATATAPKKRKRGRPSKAQKAAEAAAEEQLQKEARKQEKAAARAAEQTAVDIPEEFVLSDALKATTDTLTPGNGSFLTTPRFKRAPEAGAGAAAADGTPAVSPLAADEEGGDEQTDISDAFYLAMHRPSEEREKEAHKVTFGEEKKQRKTGSGLGRGGRAAAGGGKKGGAPAAPSCPATTAASSSSISSSSGALEEVNWEIVPRTEAAKPGGGGGGGRRRNCIVLKKRRRVTSEEKTKLKDLKMARANAFALAAQAH